MECALETDVSKVVQVSSVEVYGKPVESPIKERTQEGLFRLSHASQTRFEGDHIAWQLFRDKYLPLVAVYPCVALGSGNTTYTGGMIRRLIERRLPAILFPNSVFTFVHVSDVSEIILRSAEKTDNLGERYFAGSAWLTVKDLCSLVGDVSDVPVPILRVPGALAMPLARVLTRIADMIGRPPLFGLSTDAVRTMSEGFRIDGSKAERELGIVYTPVRKAVEEECAWHRMEFGRSWRGEERRSDMRGRIEVPCDVKGRSSGMETVVKAHVVDLSRQGMFVASDTLLDEGSEMDAELALLQFGDTFWVRGRVLRRTEEGMAVRFTERVPLDIERFMK